MLETGVINAVGRIEETITCLEKAREQARKDDYLAAIRWLNRAADAFTEAASDAAQEAYDAGASKTAIAQALGVTTRTLRGMERRA